MTKQKSDYYNKVMDRSYQPTKADMNKDISVPVKPERLIKAVMKGGATRQEPEDEET